MSVPRVAIASKTALVTGAARGIGFAIASRLAAEGARVAVLDLDSAAAASAAEKIGGGALALTADVTKSAEVAAAIRQVVAAWGRLDILVNNAGITGRSFPIWELSEEDWRRVIDADLTSVFLCCRAAVPVMLEQGSGRIINIASIAGKEGNPNASAYSASKAGVVSLTKSLGKELARTGIRVNCVTPAAVKTGMFTQMTQAHIDFMLSKIPMGRFGEVGEIAALVAWLCTEECSFSTGAVFDLSGGRAVY